MGDGNATQLNAMGIIIIDDDDDDDDENANGDC